MSAERDWYEEMREEYWKEMKEAKEKRIKENLDKISLSNNAPEWMKREAALHWYPDID